MTLQTYIPRLSIVTGIIRRGDAMSETVIADLEAVDRLARARRMHVDIRLYCADSDLADSRVRIIRNWRHLLQDEHFMTSDAYSFHYGIYNELHHAAHAMRRKARAMVFFQNITPPHLAPPEARELLHLSHQQIGNFRNFDHVLTASDFSARQLDGYDLGLPISVVPLFGANAPPEGHGARDDGARAPSGDDRSFRLLYCGRFSRSKGLTCLIEALSLAAPELSRPVELTLAGLVSLSEREYLDQLKSMVESLPNTVTVRFAPDQSQSELLALYQAADAFVLPSLHEGFGMPVAEAFLAGTPVICSTAGALPEVSGGFGLSFPAGQARALAARLGAFLAAWSEGDILCDSGRLSRRDWQDRVAAHAATFRRESYIARITPHYAHLLEPSPQWSEMARAARWQALAEHPAEDGTSEASSAFGIDAAILGTVLAQKLQRIRSQPDRVMPDLAQWLKLDEQELRKELPAAGGSLARLAAQHLGTNEEFLRSPEHRQSMVFAQASFAGHGIPSGPTRPEAEAEPDLAADSLEFALAFLKGNTSLDDHSFLQQCYRLVLRRRPDSAGLNHYLTELRAGRLTRDNVIHAMRHSPEGKKVWNMPA